MTLVSLITSFSITVIGSPASCWEEGQGIIQGRLRAAVMHCARS